VSRYYQRPTAGKRHRKLLLALTLAPFAAALLMFVTLRSGPGIIAAWAVFFGLFFLCARLRARLTASLAFAQWRAYLLPGFQGTPHFEKCRKPGAVVMQSSEIGMGGPTVEDWLLDDGALISEVCNGWQTSGDQRYMAAMTDARHRRSFVVYDRREHVCYHYDSEHADQIFKRLYSGVIDATFLASKKRMSMILDEVLLKARKEQLVACRGLWLPAAKAASIPCDLITLDLAPGVTLSATWHAPDDLRTLSNPFGPIEHPLHRISLNGEPTGLWCRRLQALATADGQSFMVKGVIIDKQMSQIGGRWYLWRSDGGWLAIDGRICASDGTVLADLDTIIELTDTMACFSVRLAQQGARAGYVQTARFAEPIKVFIDTVADGMVCQLKMPAIAGIV
jgi:hypothetical protein